MSKLGGSFSLFSPDTISSQASKVAVGKNKEHEIFVDVYEKISMIFNASGYVINSSIDGCIQMKSYLHGNPPLKLMLNDDVVMAGSANTVGGKVVLDDYNFHESVNYSDFELNKALKITPPEGEFIVMNYRVTTDFNAPFRVHAYFEESNPYKLEFVVKVRVASIYSSKQPSPRRSLPHLSMSNSLCPKTPAVLGLKS
jgi:AP-4 complex subunit mu-1